jgi:cyclopropane fatty-acyl-phospholipid synthase-like methyltransferase
MDSDADRAAHWQAAYQRAGSQSVSWFQDDPAMSRRLLAEAGLRADRSVVDVGGGASSLVDRLVDDGVTDVTVLDVADSALAEARDRLGERGRSVAWLAQDLLTWQPDRRFDIWHDRAVFHFLVSAADRDRYRHLIDAALAANGQVVIGAFAADGPEYCSGLPVARYDPASLAAEFPGFRLAGSEREEHRTPDGRIQPFTWVRLTR